MKIINDLVWGRHPSDLEYNTLGLTDTETKFFRNVFLLIVAVLLLTWLGWMPWSPAKVPVPSDPNERSKPIAESAAITSAAEALPK